MNGHAWGAVLILVGGVAWVANMLGLLMIGSGLMRTWPRGALASFVAAAVLAVLGMFVSGWTELWHTN